VVIKSVPGGAFRCAAVLGRTLSAVRKAHSPPCPVVRTFGRVPYQFEWDAEKAAANLRKHGVSFDEAVRPSATRFQCCSLIPTTRLAKSVILSWEFLRKVACWSRSREVDRDTMRPEETTELDLGQPLPASVVLIRAPSVYIREAMMERLATPEPRRR
jgi:hypothetical protein